MEQSQQTRKFYQHVWPFRADVFRVAKFLSRNPITAEDLSQETLLKAFRNIDRLKPGPGVKAWLLQILRNTWVDQTRARASHPQEVSLRELHDGPLDDGQSAETFTLDDPRAMLEAFSDQQMIDALQDLPEEIRWTMLLLYVEGLTLEEAAESLEVPTGTVKSRAHRGRQMLRAKLIPLAREFGLVANERDGTPVRRTHE